MEFVIFGTVIGLGYVFQILIKTKKETFINDDMTNSVNRYDEGWKVINDKTKIFKNVPDDIGY